MIYYHELPWFTNSKNVIFQLADCSDSVHLGTDGGGSVCQTSFARHGFSHAIWPFSPSAWIILVSYYIHLNLMGHMSRILLRHDTSSLFLQAALHKTIFSSYPMFHGGHPKMPGFFCWSFPWLALSWCMPSTGAMRLGSGSKLGCFYGWEFMGKQDQRPRDPTIVSALNICSIVRAGLWWS